jgi:hypothetical protein
MIGYCADCGHETSRYGLPEVMKAACGNCGSFIFWCLHIGFYGKPSHYVKVDLRTNELLSEDMCEVNRNG